MAKNSTHISADPKAVWSVIEDPGAYPEWVVGTDRTIGVDPRWPAPGSYFRVHVAAGYADRTVVREIEPGRRLVLDAAAGVLGPARVTITLEAEDGGTRLTLIEDPAGKLSPLRLVPFVHVAIRLRNRESLRRLQRLVSERIAA
jgi:uncharacterized protein YndB with AHSA1/START domain